MNVHIFLRLIFLFLAVSRPAGSLIPSYPPRQEKGQFIKGEQSWQLK